jgi:hypothetical protein
MSWCHLTVYPPVKSSSCVKSLNSMASTVAFGRCMLSTGEPYMDMKTPKDAFQFRCVSLTVCGPVPTSLLSAGHVLSSRTVIQSFACDRQHVLVVATCDPPPLVIAVCRQCTLSLLFTTHVMQDITVCSPCYAMMHACCLQPMLSEANIRNLLTCHVLLLQILDAPFLADVQV